MSLMRFGLLCFLAIRLSAAPAAHASESLVFSPIAPGSDADRARTLLEQLIPEAAARADSESLAAVSDLNGDGADEIFLRFSQPPPCPRACAPLFFVFGSGNGRLSLLGRFSASQVRVADSRTLGARDLLVYDDPLNDFNAARHVWAPLERRYTPWTLDSPTLLEDKGEGHDKRREP